ncbi:MAG: 4Fe-4S ferredoxin [Deltaproteobacteria bacterium]|nr:4Fe-4S ferredoxin [Deltaproteobacteria bacterium]
MTAVSLTAETIIGEIKRCVADSPDNTLGSETGEPAWAEPLVGFAAGDDQLFTTFKRDIGAYYWTPHEIYRMSVPCLAARPAELSVISWILPQTAKTKSDHRRCRTYPSGRWTRTRHFGEAFNLRLAEHLVTFLTQSGAVAVAPVLSPRWQITTEHPSGFASNWSERHAAHVAGLGTFGLCDGLITPVGKAVRIGSVIARMRLSATPRPYRSHTEWCLHYANGKCQSCIKRCPVGAISKLGHDKRRCSDYVLKKMLYYTKKRFNLPVYSCGLCQVAVPCESGIPAGITGKT